jgi:hypothetical protein
MSARWTAAGSRFNSDDYDLQYDSQRAVWSVVPCIVVCSRPIRSRNGRSSHSPSCEESWCARDSAGLLLQTARVKATHMQHFQRNCLPMLFAG